MTTIKSILILLSVGLVMACGTDPSMPDVSMFDPPLHMPKVAVPSTDPLTAEKVELGRRLFYDVRLSLDGTVSCASCHRQEFAFSDGGRQVSRGVGGATGQRNSPMIVNAAYQPYFFWDGRASTLEDQAMGAFLNPIEMAADTVAVAALLRSDDYMGRWKSAFGDTAVSMRKAMRAIATFERTLISADSPYDRFLLGNASALNAAERRGMQLYFSDKTMCSACHGGPNLTDNSFGNVGLFRHYFDRGRYEITKNYTDEALFKTPTLRNVSLSPPYMASGNSDDGALNTLEEVVEHYDKGGFPFPNKDKRVKRLRLSMGEKSDLVAFLHALTDSSVISNPRFAKP